MNPSVVSTVEAVRQAIADARHRGLTVGLVPTMGALHEGHASLIQQARNETGLVVVSLFVNPTQFRPGEDFERYPRPLAQDLELCRRERADLVFTPTNSTVYLPGFCTYVEVQKLQDVLCGASRPGHFRGVATVVLKLFHMVQPDVAYFGQKDAQQVRIIQQMVEDLNVPVTIRICPIVRAPDGLALSSRNQYLSADQREQATILYQALQEARALIEKGTRLPDVVQRTLVTRLQSVPGAVVDYAAVVDAATLQPLNLLHGRLLIAVAVKFGATRLIDNMVVEAVG